MYLSKSKIGMTVRLVAIPENKEILLYTVTKIDHTNGLLWAASCAYPAASNVFLGANDDFTKSTIVPWDPPSPVEFVSNSKYTW
jgi:hypothetical protein